MKLYGLHKSKWLNYLKKIEKPLLDIYKDEELEEKSVCSFFEHTTKDDKTYKVKYYDLDKIISVGYRVRSKNDVIKNGQVIDNNTLVAVTLLIAESNPKEKDILIDLVMNFLTK